MPRLENWAVVSKSSNPFQAPELCPSVLWGNIYDDPRFEDGYSVYTSTLKEINVKERTAKTKNTEYVLGKPAESYATFCKENNIEI